MLGMIMICNSIRTVSSMHSRACPALPHSSQVKPSSANESAYAWVQDLASTPIILVWAHAGRWMVTAAAWKDLLPKLVYPFMEWWEWKAQNELPNQACMSTKCSDC